MVLDDKGGDKILIAWSFSFSFFFFFPSTGAQVRRREGEGRGEIVGHDENDEQ